MSVVAIYGSSRRHGNTELLADRVVEGLPVEKIYLVEKSIRPIDGRRHDPGGFPRVGDDYDSVIERVLAHDTLVFATPVYWYGMSGLMKNFIDRWSQSLRDPRHAFREAMSKKSAYVVLVGGDEPRIKALPLVQQFRYIFEFMGIRFAGYVVGEANRPGDILSRAGRLNPYQCVSCFPEKPRRNGHFRALLLQCVSMRYVPLIRSVIRIRTVKVPMVVSS